MVQRPLPSVAAVPWRDRSCSPDRQTTYVGGYSPKLGVGLADVPKDLFRPKTTEELINEGHS